MAKKIHKNLHELGFSKNEARVYIAMTQLGESTASLIAKKADMPRTTAISILEKLESEKYISIHQYRGRNYYWIESPQMIKKNLERKVVLADELDTLLTDLYRSESDFPYAKIYDTKKGIKTFIENILSSTKKGTIIYTIDCPSSGNYRKVLSEQFYYAMLDLKKSRDIFTKTLVPHKSLKSINQKKILNRNMEIREMPESITFTASIWIIDDMLVLFSGKYPFIVTVHHKIITHSIKSFFDYFWSLKEDI